ncbi:MAG: hypothetical protein KF830_15395 [Planctomycetes bacterium]|nr:hypothetical protein [Planctomycetota bacterium]
MTHHDDMSARYVELASTAVNARTRQFDVPSELVAPRGYLIDNGGVPSTALWVRIQ